MKINFTKEHLEQLHKLADEALFEDLVVTTKFGQPLNIHELLYTVSINQLTEIKQSLAKKIEKLEASDEWIQADNEKIQTARKLKDLVNLIIGYKRYQLEQLELQEKKEELTAKLTELKESQKTPEDRIKEIEAQLKELEEF